MHVRERLVAIGCVRHGIFEARLRVVRVAPGEGGADRTPVVARGPSEGVLAAVLAGRGGENPQPLAQVPLAGRIARRRAEVELRGEAVQMVVAGIVLQLDEAFLEVVAEALFAGREQHPGGGEHARVPADLRVAVRPVSRAGRAVAVLAPSLLEVVVAAPRRVQAAIGERGVMSAVDRRGKGEVSTARAVASVPTSPCRY